MKKFCLFLALLTNTALGAQSPFGGNRVDDLFSVKSVDGRQAILQGKAQALKTGDLLYFTRSPFKFTVSEIRGGEIVIALPESHDLSVGNTLMRSPTDAVKKNLNTESKLKQALEE